MPVTMALSCFTVAFQTNHGKKILPLSNFACAVRHVAKEHGHRYVVIDY